MPSGADAVPWRRPKLRKVGRKSAVLGQPTSELPVWAEDAKRRLGDVPVPLQKQETVESRPEWADRRVDMDSLEQLERRHLERMPAVSAQLEWSVPRLDAAAVGRLERANKLDKIASFDKVMPPEWADRTKSLDFSKLQELDTKSRASDVKPAPEVQSSLWQEVTLVPPPPPPPPPPPSRPPQAPLLPDRVPMTEAKRAALDRMRRTARRRPDWSVMMEEITSAPGRQLRHVQCRDRSAPIVHDLKRRGNEFIFESEKEKNTSPTMKLMHDIKLGVKLKRVRCNDRSRPNLQGLRKLRRQRTSEAFLNLPPEELMDSEPEDLDDIDKVRDDLQSTRQLLGDEVKSCERLTKENKHLKAEMKRMQEEMAQSRLSDAASPQCRAAGAAAAAAAAAGAQAADAHELDEDLGALEGEMAAIREQVGASSQEAQLWQERCQSAQQELAALHVQLNELEQGRQKGRKFSMENGNVDGEVQYNRSMVKVAYSRTRDRLAKMPPQAGITDRDQLTKDEEESLEEDEQDEEELDSEGIMQKNIERDKKKQTRELKMCRSKVSHVKTKVTHAKDERFNLKNRITSLNKNLKDENRKYRELQREVNKMGEMLKESDDEDDGSVSHNGFNGESELESETESEEETSEESESESESDNEELTLNQRMEALQMRAKRHDDNEKAIKKGNYMLKTTAERLFDKLRSEKEKYRVLERELNDLVNELQ